MNINYVKKYSNALGRDMEYKTYGDKGASCARLSLTGRTVLRLSGLRHGGRALQFYRQGEDQACLCRFNRP